MLLLRIKTSIMLAILATTMALPTGPSSGGAGPDITSVASNGTSPSSKFAPPIPKWLGQCEVSPLFYIGSSFLAEVIEDTIFKYLTLACLGFNVGLR